MSFTVLLLVLAGAFLHASWNLLVKSGRDARLAAAGNYIAAALFAGSALPWLPQPAPASWPYIGASLVAQLIYSALLGATYRAGDLGHAYPLMRGAAPLLVALASGTFIGERLSVGMWAGVGLISGGIFSLILDARARGHSPEATRLALLNACFIATYTTIDGIGVRLSGAPLAYGFWLFSLVGSAGLLWAVTHRRTAPPEWRRYLPAAALGGACSLGSYSVALWAMTRAPVAAVAAVRETSIVFATALGAIFLRERLSPVRVVAAAAIAFGVFVIRAR